MNSAAAGSTYLCGGREGSEVAQSARSRACVMRGSRVVTISSLGLPKGDSDLDIRPIYRTLSTIAPIIVQGVMYMVSCRLRQPSAAYYG